MREASEPARCVRKDRQTCVEIDIQVGESREGQTHRPVQERVGKWYVHGRTARQFGQRRAWALGQGSLVMTTGRDRQAWQGLLLPVARR